MIHYKMNYLSSLLYLGILKHKKDVGKTELVNSHDKFTGKLGKDF